MSVTAVPIRPIRKGSVLKLWIALALLLLAAGGIGWAGASGLRPETTSTGLQFQTLQKGDGPLIGADDAAFIEYEGKLENGTVFDSTEGRGPAPMLPSQVIPGFSEALQKMQSGGRYRIWIPPHLGYGPQGAGGVIPPNATLQFDVTVVRVIPNMGSQLGLPPQGM